MSPKRSRCLRFRHHLRTRHPWLDPKTAGIHAGRPTGVRRQLRLKQLQIKISKVFSLLSLISRRAVRLCLKSETRRAAAMDGRRFRIEPGWRVRNSPQHFASLERPGLKELLSLVTFFAAAKKVTRLQAKALRPQGRRLLILAEARRKTQWRVKTRPTPQRETPAHGRRSRVQAMTRTNQAASSHCPSAARPLSRARSNTVCCALA